MLAGRPGARRNEGRTEPDDAQVHVAMRVFARPLGDATCWTRPTVAATLCLGQTGEALDAPVAARGYRALHRLPRVSDVLIDRIVERFTTLPRIMHASLGDLEKVGGVGMAKARSVKDGLARMVEASILERYD